LPNSIERKREQGRKRNHSVKLRADQKTSEQIRVEKIRKIGKQDRSSDKGPSTWNDVKCL